MLILLICSRVKEKKKFSSIFQHRNWFHCMQPTSNSAVNISTALLCSTCTTDDTSVKNTLERKSRKVQPGRCRIDPQVRFGGRSALFTVAWKAISSGRHSELLNVAWFTYYVPCMSCRPLPLLQFFTESFYTLLVFYRETPWVYRAPRNWYTRHVNRHRHNYHHSSHKTLL